MNDNVMIATTNNLPGYEVEEVYGEAFGLIVRSRNVFSNFGAGIKSIFGGEIKAYTKLLAETREEAISRLRAETAAKGGNAVLMMRFDSGDIAQSMNEVVAYGTAVRVKPAKNAKAGI